MPATRGRWVRFRAFLSALVPLLTCGSADAQATALKDVVIFVEGGEAPELLGLTLLEAHKGAAITFEPLPVKDGDTPLVILSRERGWPAVKGRDQLQAVLCDANPHACIPFRTTARKPPCNDIGGAAADKRPLQAPSDYRYRWCLTAGAPARAEPNCSRPETLSRSTFCAPKLIVEEYTGKKQIVVGDEDLANRTALNLRIGNLNGCSERFGRNTAMALKCLRLVTGPLLESLNHGSSRSRIARGKLTVPVWGYSMQFRSTPNAARLAEYVGKIGTLQISEGLSSGPNADSSLRYQKPSIYQWTEPSGSLPREFKQQASTMSPPDLGPGPADLEAAALGVLAKMNFVEGGSAIHPHAFPPIFILERSGLAPKHFDLSGIRAISANGLKKVTDLSCLPNDADAFVRLTNAVPEGANHATAITGIIAAARNHKGTVGPLSLFGNDPRRVWVAKLSLADFKSQPITALSLCAAMLEPATAQSPIVNISQVVEGPFREGLQSLMLDADNQSSYLFVVASGNVESLASAKKTELTSCPVFPGCYAVGEKNIISVMGLNADGSAPSSKSLTGRVFEVAAVGETMGLAVTGNQMERIGGSSVAVPYVSSLAALVSAAYRSGPGRTNWPLSPFDIKKRIVSTVDFLPQLETHVLYGRINFARALNVNSDRLLQSADGADPCRPSTVVADASQSANVRRGQTIELLGGTDAMTGKQLKSGESLQTSDILRIHRECSRANPSPVTFTVIAEGEDGPGSLKYLRNVRFKQDALPSKKGTVSFASLVEFSACLRSPSRQCAR